MVTIAMNVYISLYDYMHIDVCIFSQVLVLLSISAYKFAVKFFAISIPLFRYDSRKLHMYDQELIRPHKTKYCFWSILSSEIDQVTRLFIFKLSLSINFYFSS